jgi:hypothetical protein
MFARTLILTLIVTLALPSTALPGPEVTIPSPWNESVVAAKGKKHKSRKNQKPGSRTVTRTARQLVTQTFTSAAPLTVVDREKANPYPATLDVSGFTNGVITDVNLHLDGLTHPSPRDIDLLLSASDGRRALVMSDVGGASLGQEDAVVNIDFTLDDEAAAPLPVSQRLSSGTFQPVNHPGPADTAADAFATPAPTPDGSVALSTFDGADPNGAWQVWVMDDVGGDEGTIASWALQITAEVDVQIRERVPVSKDKKKRKNGQRLR